LVFIPSLVLLLARVLVLFLAGVFVFLLAGTLVLLLAGVLVLFLARVLVLFLAGAFVFLLAGTPVLLLAGASVLLLAGVLVLLLADGSLVLLFIAAGERAQARTQEANHRTDANHGQKPTPKFHESSSGIPPAPRECLVLPIRESYCCIFPFPGNKG